MSIHQRHRYRREQSLWLLARLELWPKRQRDPVTWTKLLEDYLVAFPRDPPITLKQLQKHVNYVERKPEIDAKRRWLQMIAAGNTSDDDEVIEESTVKTPARPQASAGSTMAATAPSATMTTAGLTTATIIRGGHDDGVVPSKHPPPRESLDADQVQFRIKMEPSWSPIADADNGVMDCPLDDDGPRSRLLSTRHCDRRRRPSGGSSSTRPRQEQHIETALGIGGDIASPRTTTTTAAPLSSMDAIIEHLLAGPPRALDEYMAELVPALTTPTTTRIFTRSTRLTSRNSNSEGTTATATMAPTASTEQIPPAAALPNQRPADSKKADRYALPPSPSASTPNVPPSHVPIPLAPSSRSHRPRASSPPATASAPSSATTVRVLRLRETIRELNNQLWAQYEQLQTQQKQLEAAIASAQAWETQYNNAHQVATGLRAEVQASETRVAKLEKRLELLEREHIAGSIADKEGNPSVTINPTAAVTGQDGGMSVTFSFRMDVAPNNGAAPADPAPSS